MTSSAAINGVTVDDFGQFEVNHKFTVGASDTHTYKTEAQYKRGGVRSPKRKSRQERLILSQKHSRSDFMSIGGLECLFFIFFGKLVVPL